MTKQEPEEPIQVPEANNNFVEENQAVSLNPSLKVDEIASSNLKGYELPLLSSFGEKETGSRGRWSIKTRWENKKNLIWRSKHWPVVSLPKKFTNNYLK